LIFALLPLDRGQEDRFVEREVSVTSDDFHVPQTICCGVKRLTQHGGELEEVADENEAQSSKVLVTAIGKYLPEALVDPTQRFQPQHTLLVNDEVLGRFEPSLQRVENRWHLREWAVITIDRKAEKRVEGLAVDLIAGDAGRSRSNDRRGSAALGSLGLEVRGDYLHHVRLPSSTATVDLDPERGWVAALADLLVMTQYSVVNQTLFGV
jgi:hypothetical protein